jgi:hypothetical protein
MNFKPEQFYTYKSLFPVRRTQTASEATRSNDNIIFPIRRVYKRKHRHYASEYLFQLSMKTFKRHIFNTGYTVIAGYTA